MKLEADLATRILIEGVVKQYLDGHEIAPCNIFVEYDEDGDQCLSVDLNYKLSSKPVDPANSLAMLGAIRDALVEAGDQRIPYVEHCFDDKQEIKGARRAC